jgi:hypothetical protein
MQEAPHAGLSRREQPRQRAAHTCHRLAADAENSRENKARSTAAGNASLQSLHLNAAETTATTSAEEKTLRPISVTPTTKRKTPAAAVNRMLP